MPHRVEMMRVTPSHSYIIPGQKIPFLCAQTSGDDSNKATLSGLTTREVHHTEETRVTDPIDLTAKKIQEIGLDSPVVQLQRGVVRLRVELNGETIGAGSGIVISSDGLILSVNHVPAIGQQGYKHPFDFISGTQVLRNLKSWSELLGEGGEAKLIADFPLLPKPEPPSTIFTPSLDETIENEIGKIRGIKASSCEGKDATSYTRYDDTIEILSVPVQIVAESPGEDLMLAKIALPEKQDPYAFVRITDSVPGEGDFVYSIGHPLGIKHNALALGEVLDASFTVDKIRKALEAHGLVISGIGNIIGKDGPSAKNFVSGLGRVLSLAFAGIDVEPLVRFLNGAIVSTNMIDHGSSGGLLCNESGEAVGITYLGLLIPFNNSPLLRYAAGVLDFRTRHLPLSNVTGSVGVSKAIPFLETHGVNVARIRDGEPSGIEKIEEKVARKKARAAIIDLLRKQNVPEEEIPDRLKQFGLEGETQPCETQSEKTDATGVKALYHFCDASLSSKPTGIISIKLKPDTEDLSNATRIVVEIRFITENNPPPDGEEVRVGIKPGEFDLDEFADEDTKALLTGYLLSEPDQATLRELDRIQHAIKRSNTITDGF